MWSFRLGMKEAIKTSHWTYINIKNAIVVHYYTMAKFDHLAIYTLCFAI